MNTSKPKSPKPVRSRTILRSLHKADSPRSYSNPFGGKRLYGTKDETDGCQLRRSRVRSEMSRSRYVPHVGKKQLARIKS